MAEKARHRTGYNPVETAAIRSTCLTVAATLGAYLDDLVVVGGLVPSLLIDLVSPVAGGDLGHVGTNDLDLGLSLGLLDDGRYMEVSSRLRTEGFVPDTNAAGNETVQRWRRGEVTVDFLMPPTTEGGAEFRVRHLEGDFGALVTPGLELAFDERVTVEVEGITLEGERITREVPVCGPGAYVALKTLAFADRAEPKDAYDMIYVVRTLPGGSSLVASKLRAHSVEHPEVVDRVGALLERDFATIDSIGPQRCAAFEHLDSNARDEAAADAFGHIDDLLQAFRT